jgi:hypothetical protein
LDAYGVGIYARGLDLHTDGRHRIRLGNLGEYVERLHWTGGPRGLIHGFTAGSCKRLTWLLANAPVDFASHITLTYHARVDERNGDQVEARNRALVQNAKRDLNRLLSSLRRELGGYCWAQEFQKRGAIHFQLLSEHAVEEQRVTLAWCKATGQLHDPQALAHSVVVKPVDNQLAARRYLIKYFGKAGQKQLPAGVQCAGRYWGASRALKAEPMAEVVSCPEMARRHDKRALDVRRGVQRFVSRALGFRWRGGRLVCWDGTLPQRALGVMERLRSYYGEPTTPAWVLGGRAPEVVEEEQQELGFVVEESDRISGRASRSRGYTGEGSPDWEQSPCRG